MNSPREATTVPIEHFQTRYPSTRNITSIISYILGSILSLTQGSHIGPLLFILFDNDLVHILDVCILSHYQLGN